MNKMKIIGVGNEGKFNHVIIEKKKGFLEWLDGLLSRSFRVNLPEGSYAVTRREGGKTVSEKIDVMENVDLHETFGGGDEVRVDVFYGKDKIFLTFICASEERQRFMKELGGISEFDE